MILEPLTGAHFREMGLDFEPEDVAGFAERDGNGGLLYAGGIWFVEGRAWATFWCEGKPPRRIHRLAIKVMRAAVQAGVDEVWAQEDETVPGAAKWLERFGFERVGHEKGVPVWRVQVDGRPNLDDDDGRRRGNQRLWLNQPGAAGSPRGEV